SHVTGVRLAIQYDRLAISGRVTDASGTPLPDTRVMAAQAGPGNEAQFYLWQQLPSTMTDTDGHFTIGNLVAGTYALRARGAAGVEGTAENVQAGRSDLVIVVEPGGSIEGTVVGFAGPADIIAMPLAGSTGAIARGSPDEGNHFRLQPVMAGTYQIS